tara:strand:+ start:374 stop:958 length:585 start_codon:yes stop_codon:yes gene_type:complete
MSSTIGVQNIAHTNGTVAATVDSEGGVYIKNHVLQVKYFQLTTMVNEAYSTANTDQAITNFVVNITPKSTSSIMKIEAHMMFEWTNLPWNTMWFFYRDTTKLGNTQASSGSRRIGISPSLPSHGNTASPNNDSTPEFATLTYFDDPQTTSAINYKLGVNSDATNMLFINRTVGDTDSIDFERGVSFISVTEIGG